MLIVRATPGGQACPARSRSNPYLSQAGIAGLKEFAMSKVTMSVCLAQDGEAYCGRLLSGALHSISGTEDDAACAEFLQCSPAGSEGLCAASPRGGGVYVWREKCCGAPSFSGQACSHRPGPDDSSNSPFIPPRLWLDHMCHEHFSTKCGRACDISVLWKKCTARSALAWGRCLLGNHLLSFWSGRAPVSSTASRQMRTQGRSPGSHHSGCSHGSQVMDRSRRHDRAQSVAIHRSQAALEGRVTAGWRSRCQEFIM